MNGRIPEHAAALQSGALARVSPARSAAALFAALAVGAAALASPPIALFMLAALGAFVLMRGEHGRIDFASLIGPAVAAVIVGAFTGLAGGIGTLFVWRMFADTHWSVREAARLALIAGRPAETSWRSLAHAWLTPLYGLTLVAYTAPHMIAGLPLDLPHVPVWVPMLTGAATAGALFDWSLRRAADWRLGELAAGPAAHLLTHHVIFLAAFGFSLDVSAGIVALMAWRLAHAASLSEIRIQKPEIRST
ncbi:hypothetical protein [Vitreimonas sp.]|uniref:hypothetical protein n=1 Tax=Vitreimonas sp. TaxID=3069702 RepID=UPI002D79AC33|nr:hypothetical protein [Vitreimonas sp.]